MRNEEPTRTDPLPGFTGDLAAGFGASLGWLSAHPERRLEDRSWARREQELAAATEGELTTGARALSSQASQGHVELRRLYGRPC